MREILFKGKRVDNGEWVHGFLTVDDSKTPNQFVIDYLMPHKSCYGQTEVDPETVGQFTGLTDKNGKNIFEGDILRYTDIYDYALYLEATPEELEEERFNDIWSIGEVVYCSGMNYPAFDLKNHPFEVNGLSELISSTSYFYEVIGNIYDNPELLKGE